MHKVSQMILIKLVLAIKIFILIYYGGKTKLFFIKKQIHGFI